MRIALPHQKQGLNDEGVMPANMKTIAREVEKFSSWLARKKRGQKQKRRFSFSRDAENITIRSSWAL